MNRNLVIIIAAAILIAGGFFVLKKSNTAVIAENQIVPQETSLAATPGNAKAPATKPSGDVPPEKKKDHVERLTKEGYVDNPEDPYTMIKKVKGSDGKEKTYVMPKDPGPNDYFEPVDRAIKTAEELINSKINENPEEEAASLKSFDDSDQNSMMLLGKFRDDVTDIEFQISKAYDEQDKATDQDMVCFVAPKLAINIKKNMNAKLLVDGTGYGLLKLSDKLFIRMAWSYEKKRILHGIVLQMFEGKPRTLQFFSATENAEGLKHCK